jgi:cytochrome c-type biogenesis protein CcmH/NrfG
MNTRMGKMVISALQKRGVFFGLTCFFVCVVLFPQPVKALDNGTGTGTEAPVQGASERKIADEIVALRGEMKEKPTDSAASRLGQLLLGKGALNEAMEAFDVAMELNPRSFEARIGKGIVLGRQGEFAKAEQVLRDALVLNPNPVRVHYELGQLYEKQDHFGKAVSEYKEGLKKSQEGKK